MDQLINIRGFFIHAALVRKNCTSKKEYIICRGQGKACTPRTAEKGKRGCVETNIHTVRVEKVKTKETESIKERCSSDKLVKGN